MLLFEGGKSMDINNDITQEGVQGAKRFLQHFGMLNPHKKAPIANNDTIYIESSAWVRARHSGLFQSRAQQVIGNGEAVVFNSFLVHGLAQVLVF